VDPKPVSGRDADPPIGLAPICGVGELGLHSLVSSLSAEAVVEPRCGATAGQLTAAGALTFQPFYLPRMVGSSTTCSRPAVRLEIVVDLRPIEALLIHTPHRQIAVQDPSRGVPAERVDDSHLVLLETHAVGHAVARQRDP